MSDEKEIKPGEEKKVPLEKGKSNTSGAKKKKKVAKSGTTDLGEIKDGDTVEIEFENKQEIPTADQGTDLKQDIPDTKVPESPTSETEQDSPRPEAESNPESENEEDQRTEPKQEARKPVEDSPPARSEKEDDKESVPAKPSSPGPAIPNKGSAGGSKLAQPLRPLAGNTPTSSAGGDVQTSSEIPENSTGADTESSQAEESESENQEEDKTIPFPASSKNSDGTANEQDLKENDNLLYFPGSQEQEDDEPERSTDNQGSEEDQGNNDEEESEEGGEKEAEEKRSLREKGADKVREQGEKAKTPLRAAKKGIDAILVWGIFFLYLCVIGLLFWLPFIGAILIMAAYVAGVFLYASFIVPLIESIEEPIIQAEDKIDDFVEKGASAIEGKINSQDALKKAA